MRELEYITAFADVWCVAAAETYLQCFSSLMYYSVPQPLWYK